MHDHEDAASYLPACPRATINFPVAHLIPHERAVDENKYTELPNDFEDIIKLTVNQTIAKASNPQTFSLFCDAVTIIGVPHFLLYFGILCDLFIARF